LRRFVADGWVFDPIRHELRPMAEPIYCGDGIYLTDDDFIDGVDCDDVRAMEARVLATTLPFCEGATVVSCKHMATVNGLSRGECMDCGAEDIVRHQPDEREAIDILQRAVNAALGNDAEWWVECQRALEITFGYTVTKVLQDGASEHLKQMEDEIINPPPKKGLTAPLTPR